MRKARRDYYYYEKIYVLTSLNWKNEAVAENSAPTFVRVACGFTQFNQIKLKCWIQLQMYPQKY